MYKWVLVALFAVVSAGLVYVILFGLQPRPVRLMEASYFDELNEVGQAVYRRLYQEVGHSQIVLVGSSPFIEGYEKPWKAFMASAAHYKRPFQKILQHKGLKPIYESASDSAVEMFANKEEMFQQVQASLDLKEKVIIHTTANLSSHFVAGNWIQEIRNRFAVNVAGITQSFFAVRVESTTNWQPQCKTDGTLSVLTCKSLDVSKRFYRKELDPQRIVSVLEKHGSNDYILFIHTPINQ